MTTGRLSGKIAIVTGAARGQGLAEVESFRREGAVVVACDVLDHDGPVLDVTSASDWQRVVDATVAEHGRVDVLVNNAATNPYLGPMIDIDLPRLDKTYDVNLRGAFVWTQEAWRRSMQEHGGVVVNISSIGGMSVETSIGHYNVTKAALIHLTRSLAADLAPGVRVVAICPGLVKTDMARALWEPNEEGVARIVPLQRLGEPEDIANAAVFLASDAASWITGTTLVVDGGMLL